MSIVRPIFTKEEIALFNSSDFIEEESSDLTSDPIKNKKSTMYSLYFSEKIIEDKTQAQDNITKKDNITEEKIKEAFVDTGIRSQAERLTQDNILKGNDIKLLLPIFFCYALRNKEALLTKLTLRLFRDSNLKDEVKPLLSKILKDDDFVKIDNILPELRFSFNVRCTLDQFKAQLNSFDKKLVVKKSEEPKPIQPNVNPTTKPIQPAALQKLPSDNKLAVKKAEATNSVQSNVNTTIKLIQPAAAKSPPVDPDSINGSAFVNKECQASPRGNRHTSLYLQDRNPSDLSKEKRSQTLTPGKLRKMGFQYASEGNVYQQLPTQGTAPRRRPSK